MNKIFVPDMHCENCVRRITAALTEAGIDATVDLKTQTVTVVCCAECVEKAKNEIFDLGFTPEIK